MALILAACGGGHGGAKGSKTPAVVIALVDQNHPALTAVPGLPTPAPTPAITPAPLSEQLCLVSPSRGIPLSYVPPDLVTLPQGPYVGPAVLMRKQAAEALTQLLNGAAAQHVYLFAVSGYRSAELQQQTLDAEIKQYGPEKAYSEVALPGHSEHQLGDAVDVLSVRDPVDMDDSFGDTPEGKWLAANAPAYGFVVSYPKGSQPITGYVYEPWHIRYVGVPLAQEITASGLTLTQYLPLHGMDGCPLQYGELTPTPAAATATPGR
jgi:D-alanyl-D-alanine carboxypeptidase